MTGESLFKRIVVIHTGERLELDLLEYAALFASFQPDTQVLVAALPNDEVLRSLASGARAIFAPRNLVAPTIYLLSDCDLDAAFETTCDHQADLLMMRHPGAFEKSRGLARRILSEAPCSVCLVPRGTTPIIERIVAGVGLNLPGRALLEQAADLCRGAQAEELIAVHSCFHETTDADEMLRERFCLDQMLGLFRIMAGAQLRAVNCIPLVHESPHTHRSLVKVAVERKADLVVVGKRPGIPPHIATKLLWECSQPVLQVVLPKFAAGRLKVLCKRLFPVPEPAFN